MDTISITSRLVFTYTEWCNVNYQINCTFLYQWYI